VNTSKSRGTVFSVFMITDDLGKGLGPAAVALLIPIFGRVRAFNMALGGWVLCAVFLAGMGYTIEDDEARISKVPVGVRKVKDLASMGATESIEV
jgi:MFS-type transporter involved in bile tolerance (Atg22 family)